MRAIALLPPLSLAAAVHIPSPQEAFVFAENLLHPSNGAEEPAENILSAAADMRLADVEGMVTLTSATHPNHKVRIKSTDGWCDPKVKSYSGYLDVGHGKELWFSFFESRNDPANDPVIMWINGGPGCSSAIGLLMELGPCTVKDDPKNSNDTIPNKHSWNKNANIFFLDEPVNVGFSHARHGQMVSSAEEAGQDVAAFVSIFFDTFKEYRGRAFHMAGESYGGRYLPVFASAVYDNNAALVAAGKEPINLQSVMIGNGITDFYSTQESYYQFECTKHVDLNRTITSIGGCVEMAEGLPRCHKMMERDCLDSQDPTQCRIALDYCTSVLQARFFYAGLNPYDVSKKCTLQELQDSLCYPETDKIKVYLNLDDTRERLGIDKHKKNWESCNSQVGFAFNNALDPQGKTWLYVGGLLERGVRVLNYVGTLDWICNYIGNENWMEALEWTGQAAYNKAKLQPWTVKGKRAGEYKTARNLTFLKVFGAGHMVPMDQPAHASAFLSDWLNAGTVGKDADA